MIKVILVLVGRLPRFPVPVLQPLTVSVSHPHPGGLLEPEDTLLFLLLIISCGCGDTVATTGAGAGAIAGADVIAGSDKLLFLIPCFSLDNILYLFVSNTSCGLPLDADDIFKFIFGKPYMHCF